MASPTCLRVARVLTLLDPRRSTVDNHIHLSVVSAELASVPILGFVCFAFSTPVEWNVCVQFCIELPGWSCRVKIFWANLFALFCMILLNPPTVLWDRNYYFPILMMSWYWGKLNNLPRSGLNNKKQIRLKCLSNSRAQALNLIYLYLKAWVSPTLRWERFIRLAHLDKGLAGLQFCPPSDSWRSSLFFCTLKC